MKAPGGSGFHGSPTYAVLAASESSRPLGIRDCAPKVAMISYSTGVSGGGEDVKKVRMATEIAHARYAELVLDGPLQYGQVPAC
jgi:phosphate acetyltransferase